MAIDGAAERAYIMDATTGIGSLAGGRVFKTAVPDDYVLPKFTDGKVKPYIVVRFSRPFASTRGRAIAGGEQSQPHIMSFTITAYAGDADSAEITMAAVQNKLVGLTPPSAGFIQAKGGFSFPESESGAKPSRFGDGSFFSLTVNL